MDRKLTLKLDGVVIDRVKEYAESNHQSVSGLVENYFRALTEAANAADRTGKLVSELSGIITLPENYDEKADYRLARAMHRNE